MEEKNSIKQPLFFDNPETVPEVDIKKDETLSERLLSERLELKKLVEDLSKRIKDINGVHELQADVYSQRQIILERYHYLATLLAKQNQMIRKKKKKKLEFYSNEYQYTTTPKQKEELIMGDLKTEYETKEELDNHMKYLSQTITTVDNLIYGIKYRIQIEEYRRRL